MLKTPRSSHEAARLAALAEYKILDTPPEGPFDDLVLLVSQVLALPIATISFADDTRIWHKARYGTEMAEHPREQCLCGYAIGQDGIFEIADTRADERFATFAEVAREGGIRFYAGAPLVTPEGFHLGAVCVMDRVPRRLDERQKEALLALARQGVALLELRRALENLSRSYRQLHLLAEMNRMLQLCRRCEDSYDIIGDFGFQLFSEESGCVYLRERESGELRPVAAWGALESRSEALSVSDCLALRQERAHSMDEAAEGAVCPHLAGMPVDDSLCLPVTAHGETLGVLSLVAPAQPAEGHGILLSESTKSLAGALAQAVGLALGNLRLRESLESQSVRDSLTGLFNRRYLEESLERELAQAARQRLPLGLIMIDLDNFKNYNDRFGHFAGDELLHTVGEMLRGGVRAGDIACRYGGDEFSIILPGASLAITLARAEELCQAIKQLEARFEKQGIEPITLSAGVAAYPDHGAEARDLLRLADVALYRAKAQGRDQSVVAASPATTV